MSYLRSMLRAAASRPTRVIGMYWGETFPFYYVSEYPKSGGSWLGKMVADCLRIPYPEGQIFPAGFRCVIHNHWRYNPRFRRVLYVYRDGRDVMVSLFFHRMRTLARRDSVDVRIFKRQYDRLFGKGYDPNDSIALLPRFIENEFKRPRNPRVTWSQHIESWCAPDGHPHVTCLSYEQLVNDCRATLKRAIELVTGATVDQWRIDTTVEKFSMVRQTGRRPGEEDRGAFIRKGVAGDWPNHFSLEAAEVFNDLAGDALIHLGYEKDRDWVRNYPAPSDVRPARVDSRRTETIQE